MESIDPVLMSYLPNDMKDMFFPFVSVQLGALLLNLLVGFGLALIIGTHFRKYASTFCNRQDFSRLFPLLMLTIILIITVVKASLALALGLVGALSIVRFRTPIKEPEELIYLFLNIGVAVSLGAGQTMAAILACAVTLFLVTWVKKRDFGKNDEKGLFLHVSYACDEGEQLEVSLEELKELLRPSVNSLELRRFDVDHQQFDATFFISVMNAQKLDEFIRAIKNKLPKVNISLLEQHNIAGV